jgi:hypothetical protein
LFPTPLPTFPVHPARGQSNFCNWIFSLQGI